MSNYLPVLIASTAGLGFAILVFLGAWTGRPLPWALASFVGLGMVLLAINTLIIQLRNLREVLSSTQTTKEGRQK